TAGNDLLPELLDADLEALAQGILGGPQPVRHRFIHDRNSRGAGSVGRRESTATPDRRSERREIVGADHLDVRSALLALEDGVRDSRDLEIDREAHRKGATDGHARARHTLETHHPVAHLLVQPIDAGVLVAELRRYTLAARRRSA